ncbi:MAG: hypothetical protein LBI59_01560, partial [Candidatus Accumulibacter sp.]|nr:hypothetical protein [Accumulibacter sp.]
SEIGHLLVLRIRMKRNNGRLWPIWRGAVHVREKKGGDEKREEIRAFTSTLVIARAAGPWQSGRP